MNVAAMTVITVMTVGEGVITVSAVSWGAALPEDFSLPNELLDTIGPVNATPIHFAQNGVERSLAQMDRLLIAINEQRVGDPVRMFIEADGKL